VHAELRGGLVRTRLRARAPRRAAAVSNSGLVARSAPALQAVPKPGLPVVADNQLAGSERATASAELNVTITTEIGESASGLKARRS
jgi:hypothetical protein